MNKKTFLHLLKVAVLVGLVFVIGFLMGQQTADNASKSGLEFGNIFQANKVEFSLVEDVWNLINQKYVNSDDIDREALIYGAIRGMLEELNDPYTVFFDREEIGEFLDSIAGSFEGVGMEIGIREDHLTVITPLKDSPAERAGVKSGDKIIAIDGEDSTDLTLEEAVTKIRGERGTVVTLTVLRGEQQLDIRITRDVIQVPSLRWNMEDDNVAYIEVIQFSDNSEKELKKIAGEILESDANKIILDLRNNPGGLLDSAISIAGWFISKGEVVVIEERGDGVRTEHKSLGPATFRDFPMAVLVNEGSASASEILAGAFRDQNKTPIIGKQTFGKGLVQSLESLSGGASLKITIARWVTPLGHYINSVGIEPDIEVELTQEDLDADLDPQKSKAIEVIRGL